MITNHGEKRSNFQSCCIILFKCPLKRKQQLRHAKKREYMCHTQGNKNQSIEIILEEAQILDLLDKDFKSVIINIFK